MGKKEKKKKKRTLSRAQLLQGSGDFKRKKTKLGKTEKPTNFTSTEFRSRALVLPSQSVLEEKGPIVTQRHLNLKDLVAQLSHTNPQVRRDAVYGLRELHRNYPNSLCDHIGLIFERLLPLIEDSERSVRHAVHALLRVLIPHLDHILIAPFLPLIAMYISSALTHLSEDVRLDALVVLNLILDYFPRLVKGLLGELFPNFIALLSTSRGSTSTSTKGESGMKAAAPATLKISPGARLTSLRARETILSALIKLLRMAFSCPMTTAATNDPVISDAVWEAEGPNVCFLPRAMAPTQPVPSPHDAMSFNAKELLTTLAPVLLECWIECEPASLEGVSITKLDVMAHVLNVFEILLSAVCVKGESSSGYGLNMKDLDKYLVTYFPIVVTSKDPKILRTTADVNLSMCSVMCYFIRNKDVGEEEPWETSVLNFLVAQSWNEETRVRGMDVSFLLGVIQRIIVHVSELRRSQLLKTVGSLFGSLPATSAGKRACLSFMTAFFSDMQRTRTLPVDIAKSWLHALPKLIWQLQAKSEVATELALRVLHAFARRASRSPESQALYDGLQAPLVPFFRSVLRTKTSGEMRYVWGPFVHLSAGLQCRALDLLFFFSSLGEELVQSLCACCKDPRISPHTLLYALDILDQRLAVRDALPRAHYLSLLLCVGTCPAETREIRGRWDEVQDGCVRALKVLRLGSFLLRVLWPALDAIMSRDDLTLSQWRGTIQILAACCEEGHELFVEGGHPTPDALNLASAVRSALPIQLQRYLYFLVSHNHPCDKTPLPLLVQVVPPLLGELISLCGSKIAGEEEKKKKKEKKEEEEEEEEEEETDHLLVCLRVTGAVLADDRMRSSLGSCSQSLKIVAQNVDALLDRRRPCGFSTDPVYGEGQRLRSELALCGWMASSQTPCPSPRQLTYCVEEYLRACETHNVRPVQEVQERLGNPLATVLATSEWPRRVWTNGDIMALTAGLAVNRVVKTVALPRLGPAVLTVEVLGTVAAALLRTRCVTSLDLSGNDLSDDAVLALDSLLLGSNGPLVVLDVSRNDVGLRGGRMLARAIQLARRLRCLDMRFNPLGGPQSPIGRLLVDALRARHSFRRLAVHLPEGSGEALTVALREGSVRLQSLILAHRRSDLHSVDQLATLLRTPLTSLTHLDLTHAYIGDTGAHVLGEALGHNSALVSLSLQSNAITTRGVTSFVQGIKENVTLTDINLSSNTLGDAGASTLASFVRENAVLTSLDLGRNGIGDEGATALLQVFQGSYNTTLVTLGDLSSTPMSVAIRHSLEGAVTRNRDRAMEMADRAAADVLLRRGHLSQADMDLPSSLRYNRALQRYAVLADSFERLKAENALLKTELEEMRQSEGVKREKDTRSGRRGGKYKGRRRSSRK